MGVLWLLCHWSERRKWYKPAAWFVVLGAVPYALVLYLMQANVPKFIAGGLSLKALNEYLGSTGVVGSLSAYAAPGRILASIAFLAV